LPARRSRLRRSAHFGRSGGSALRAAFGSRQRFALPVKLLDAYELNIAEICPQETILKLFYAPELNIAEICHQGSILSYSIHLR